MVLERVVAYHKNMLPGLASLFMFLVSILLFAVNAGGILVILVTFIACMSFLLLLFKRMTRPSALIIDGKLKIRSGLFDEHVIPKHLIEALTYETGHIQRVPDPERYKHVLEVEMHMLNVKLKGFTDWEIRITDIGNHINDLRLYKFIRDNFYSIPQSSKT